MNKYVDFVSDEDFIECVSYVINSYSDINEDIKKVSYEDVLKHSKNTIDEFKTIFDVCVNNSTFNDWSKTELKRQRDKTINNKIGEFHQKLLGKVDGWIDLGIGDETEIDLKNEDNTIFVELKNKYNTMNSNSTKTCREKLENILQKYPNATTYWAYIVNKNYKSEDRVWEYKGVSNEQIRRISGDKIYEIITGDPDALEKTLRAVPLAIEYIMGNEYSLSKEDKEIFDDYSNFIFNQD